MNSRKKGWCVAVLLLPLALIPAGSSAAEDDPDKKKVDVISTPDLVITEDTQIALHGRYGKAVTGSCKYEDPLWEGKIALKNIGSETVEVPEEKDEETANEPVVPAIGGDVDRRRREREKRRKQKEELPPHVRVYVPNNIQFVANRRLTHHLDEFGQELLTISIGRDENKCRNYEAPPVFDERLSGLAGPLHVEHVEEQGPPDVYSWRIKKIQRALIAKGYSLTDDGDYGPQTIKALEVYFKDQHRPPPSDLPRRPPLPETVSFLLEALGIPVGDGPPPPGHSDGGTVGAGGDECRRGVNLVPVYIEIDPLRAIPNEYRANNRVQFMVAIDCSNVAR